MRIITNASLIMALLLLSATAGNAQGIFSKVIAKLGGAVGKGNDQTTSTLNDMVPIVAVGSNLHPTELGTIGQAFFPTWKTGGDFVYVMFTKKNSAGFYKIDGTVTCNGVPVEYATSGSYALITDPDPSARKIEITTSTGEKAGFTIQPSEKKIKLLSINGLTDKISVDLNQDMVLELDTKVPEGTLLRVSIAINQVSIKSIYEVCYARSGAKITIPAAAFRNTNITPGGSALYNYKKSFLQIGFETVEQATDVTGILKAVEYRSSYTDGKFITVSKEPALNTGMTVKGTEAKMDYTCFKPNAFLSRPFSQIKKIGFSSFAIRGTTYRQYSEGNEQVTIVTTLKFPPQPDEVWDALLEDLYPDFMAVIQEELAPVVPLESVTGAPSYSVVDAFSKDDVNTTVEFERAFRNSKVVSAFMPIGEGYGVNGVNQRIMNEVGLDALITLTLDLEISEGKSGLILMTPKLAMEIVGKTNGTTVSTKFCTVNIKSSVGTPFNNNITQEKLKEIVRKSDMLTVFRKALKEIKEKERSNPDYEAVWSLQ